MSIVSAIPSGGFSAFVTERASWKMTRSFSAESERTIGWLPYRSASRTSAPICARALVGSITMSSPSFTPYLSRRPRKPRSAGGAPAPGQHRVEQEEGAAAPREEPLEGAGLGREERGPRARDHDDVGVGRKAFLAERLPGRDRHVVALEHLLDVRIAAAALARVERRLAVAGREHDARLSRPRSPTGARR